MHVRTARITRYYKKLLRKDLVAQVLCEGYQQGAVWPGGKTGNRRKQCKGVQAHRASAQPPENHWDGQIELETPPDGVRRSHEKCPNARSLLRSGAVYLVWSLI